MLVSSRTILEKSKKLPDPDEETQDKLLPVSISSQIDHAIHFVSDKDIALTKAIGLLVPGINTHFYSFGNFNLVRLIMYIIKQTGPVHVFMTSYSFSQKSILQLQKSIEQKQMLSFRIVIDNRVRSISPKPFQLISTIFNYRCTSVHAKIALLWNDQWNISIVTSQNATDNPKMERGIIFTDKTVFDFDHKNLTDAFSRGTT